MSCMALVGISLSTQGCMESPPPACKGFAKWNGQVCILQKHCLAVAIGHGEVSATAKGEEAAVFCDKGFTYKGPKLACIVTDNVCRIDEKRSVCRPQFKYRRKSKVCTQLGKEPNCKAVLGFGKPGSGKAAISCSDESYGPGTAPAKKKSCTDDFVADVPVVPEGDVLAAEVAANEANKLTESHEEHVTASYECTPLEDKDTGDDGPASEALFSANDQVVHDVSEGLNWPLGVSMGMAFLISAIVLGARSCRRTSATSNVPAYRDVCMVSTREEFSQAEE